MNKPLLSLACLGVELLLLCSSPAQAYRDNPTQYSNQDPNTETRRSDHFRLCLGHYNRDNLPITEEMLQGNLQMFEQCWHRWVVELGMHDINESATQPDGNKYRTNFNFLATWNDGGGGGAYSSMDAKGFAYSMANATYCRFDPPSGTIPHEFGHVWEGSAGGFNASDSAGAWWECTADWMMLQFKNDYPQAQTYLMNSIYYPAHGRNYYHCWCIWEAARDDSRYGTNWVNRVWTDATPEQKISETMLDRMIRLDSSGSADKAGALKDLWGDMAKKMVTWDFARHRWLVQANTPSNWGPYDGWHWQTTCRAPLIKMPGASGFYRPARECLPQQFGFHIIPLTATPGATVTCNFQPLCDYVRQSDWRACLVAVNQAGEASYSALWNIGANSMALSADQTQLFLMVIAVPKPMKLGDPAWQEYTRDSGLQFPYTVSFTNTEPLNVIYPVQAHEAMTRHPNGLGWVAATASVDPTAYVGPDAQVLENAQVKGFARIEDFAVVRENAQVRENAVVSGHALVRGNAQVYGSAKIRDWAIVGAYTQVYGNAKVIEHAFCLQWYEAADNFSRIYGDAIVKGNTVLNSPSTLSGYVITDGDSSNGGTGDHGVHFGWHGGINASIWPNLADNHHQYAGLTFERDNPVFAMDEFGINHGFLVNGCRTALDSGSSLRGGRVLALNGTNQYVELHNSINDFKDSTFALWFKPTGPAADQVLFSMGDGSTKAMTLTANASGSGGLRFCITNGTSSYTLNGPAVAPDSWSHAAVVFSGSTCSLYLNGTAVNSNAAVTLFPENLNAPLMENANYLGRDNTGNYFTGNLDEVRVYSKGMTAQEVMALYNTPAPAAIPVAADNTPPTPNAATWLVVPTANGDSSVTMSATPGSDESGWVEYYFSCVSSGGHDSGWVSFNKYTDVGVAPGSSPAYTVKMRDRSGNTTAPSQAETVSLPSSSAATASFSYGPIGSGDGQITMTASQASSPSGKVEYKFDRIGGASSGWQSSPTWTQSSLTTGSTYSYTVSVRDGRGNVSLPSAAASAVARDDAGPALPIPEEAHWLMLPYATIENKISMTATEASDPAGVEYYFQCVSGGGPDSGWQASPTFVTPAGLPDGTYVYRYKLRDLSANHNESVYSNPYTAKITPTTGYHDVRFAQLTTLPDDCLVSFNAVVTQAKADYYLLMDVASLNTIKVKSDLYAQATDSSKLWKICKVKGHLWTYSGERQVTYASLTPLLDAPSFTVSGKITDAGSGRAIPYATVYFSPVPGAAANPAFTGTADANGNYAKKLPNGLWFVASSAPDHLASEETSLTVSGQPVVGMNFTLTPVLTISVSSSGDGQIDGSIIRTGTLRAAYGESHTFTIVPGFRQSIGSVVVDGIDQGSLTSYTFDNLTSNHSLAVTFVANVFNTPQTGSVIASALSIGLPDSGAIFSWNSYLPAGKSYNVIGAPITILSDNAKWIPNLYANQTGFDCGAFDTIPCNGASVVAVIKPTRNSDGGNWRSIVDVFYNRLVLGILNNTGEIIVWRNGAIFGTGVIIPEGQTTVLSLVCQADGQFKLYSNGAQVYSNSSTSPMTSLVPGVPGPFATHITVGRNWPDGWTTYNGKLGSFFLYSVALSDPERLALEADLSSISGLGTGHTILASAGSGGKISPSGAIAVPNGGSVNFVIQPDLGYALSQVTVDGTSMGAIASYSFSDVTTSHSISASFAAAPTCTLTATSGSNGSITPSGTVTVNAGSEKTFNISPAIGYLVADLLVDGTSLGPVSSYIFSNIQASHTIAASFSPVMLTISASTNSGGSISPAGSTQVAFGGSQTFTFTPEPGYSVAAVLVDGVDLGSLTSYTFDSVSADHSLSVVFFPGTWRIPAPDQLHFSADTNGIIGSDQITAWQWLYPTGNTLTRIGLPTVQTLDGVKWESNHYASYDGFIAAEYNAAVPLNGCTALCAVKPVRNGISTGWTSIIDVMYGEMVLGIRNDNGLPFLRLKKNTYVGTIPIPDGQSTVLALVVQPGGSFALYANGVQIMSGNGPAMTEWLPGNTSGNPDSFDRFLAIGRNGPDGWTTFNGSIGDLFLYRCALADFQRRILEADLMTKFAAATGGTGGPDATFSISASASSGGVITPSGTSSVLAGASFSYSIQPNPGYSIQEVQIDGISVGVVGSFSFDWVSSNHTIYASFLANPTNEGLGLSDWQQMHFSAAEILAGKSNPSANPDGDSFNNLAEFALGTNPQGQTPALSGGKTSQGFQLTFQRPKGLRDVTYWAESSEDLMNWTPCNLELVTDGPIQTMRAWDPLTSGNPNRRFLRLRFTTP